MRAALVPVGFVVLSGWTVAKGVLPFIHTDELYFWLTTYQHGFVRRGLLGTLVAPLIGPIGPARVHLVAAEICLVALLVLLVLMAIVVWRHAAQSRGPAPWAIAGLLATSPLIGLIAHHVGYPDGIIAVAVLACSLALPRAPPWAIALMLILCSMLHELAFLLLLPIVVLNRILDYCGELRGELLIGAVAIISLCLPLFGSQAEPGLMSHLLAAGLNLNDASEQVATSLHQGIAQAAEKMLVTWHRHPLNGCLGILYAGFPGLMLMILGWPSMLRRTKVLPSRLQRLLLESSYIAACMSAVALLTIAWDLARLVSFTTLTSLIAVNRVSRRGDNPAEPTPIAASFGVAFVLTLLPIFNVYFDYARPLRLTLMSSVCSPCAKMAVNIANFYNRDLPEQERAKLASDPLYGDEQ